jgi:hypothetical protein
MPHVPYQSEDMADSSQINSITQQLATQRTESHTTDDRQCITPLLSHIAAVKQDLENLKRRHREWEEEFGEFVSERASMTADLTNHYSIISSVSISARNTIRRLDTALNAMELQVVSMQSADNQSDHSNATAVLGDRTPHGEVACEIPLPACSVGCDERTERQHLDAADDASNDILADEDCQSEEAPQAELFRNPEHEQPSCQSNDTIASIVQSISPPSNESYAAPAGPGFNDEPRGNAGRAMSIVVVHVDIAPVQFLPTPSFWEGFPPEIFSEAPWLRSTSPDIEPRLPDIDLDTVLSMVASWREGVVPGGH